MEPDVPSEETLEVGKRRYDEAVAAGLTIGDALIFADSGEDIGTLRKLVATGCPVGLLAPILFGRPD